MDSKIHPSPAILVRANADVSECLHLMREHKVGSVLIVNDNGDGELLGIFTERDFITKIDFKNLGYYWSTQVRYFMSSPVRTLDVSQLNQAAELMLKYYIRHIPITMMDKQSNQQRVMGVVSMRDLFKILVSQKIDQKESRHTFTPLNIDPKDINFKVTLISKDDHFSTFTQEIFRSFLSVNIQQSDFENEILKPSHILVVDLDHFDIHQWPQFLISKNHDPNVKLIIIAFDPSQHLKDVISKLDLLSNSEKFLILKKPIDVLRLYEKLSSTL